MDQILNFILKGISVISLEYETFTCFYQKKKNFGYQPLFFILRQVIPNTSPKHLTLIIHTSIQVNY